MLAFKLLINFIRGKLVISKIARNFQVSIHNTNNPIVSVTVILGTKPSQHLDTGATVTLLSETTWESIDCPTLQPTDVLLQIIHRKRFPLSKSAKLRYSVRGSLLIYLWLFPRAIGTTY